MSMHPGYAFDVATVLGFGTPCADPLPAPGPGEVVLRIPEGLSLQALRDSDVGKRLVHDQRWYNRHAWGKRKLLAGCYRLRLLIPLSDGKSAREQEALLQGRETFAPAALLAVAILCMHVQGVYDSLRHECIRCIEGSDIGYNVELAWRNDRLFIGERPGGLKYVHVWAASSSLVSSTS